ncbi:LOW QUALITY PROTEIN: hypothetical protein CRUP_008651 [Coryphaenoides rupestris]|nr:LOW QUALITY PROTEIN: hypothetical protein CRUP_008651 [Coryphaenoides rupestris]
MEQRLGSRAVGPPPLTITTLCTRSGYSCARKVQNDTLEERYGAQVLRQGVEGVRRRDLGGLAGAVAGQVRRDHLVAQPREEVQLTAPDVQGAAYAVHEEQRHVALEISLLESMSTVRLGLRRRRLGGGAGFWSPAAVAGGGTGGGTGLGSGDEAISLYQLHLHGAAGLQVAVLTLQDLRVQHVAQVLDHQLPVASTLVFFFPDAAAGSSVTTGCRSGTMCRTRRTLPGLTSTNSKPLEGSEDSRGSTRLAAFPVRQQRIPSVMLTQAEGSGVFPQLPWQYQQVRTKKRGMEYQPKNIKRKRTHGWIKRVSSKGGIEVLLRRMLKGRKSLCH